ncbi:MAG: TlpA family protein disulfide reductase [Acidobacteria bacterium]|nr:TlpA family protein disulfide reductase [Acidobacteriota bacterium]
MEPRIAGEWEVSTWLNAPADTRLEDYRGKVVVALAFQMLCPGCAQLAIPQFRKLHESIRHPKLAVLGLHTVFEHHGAMGKEALEAFAHEYRLQFPIAIDRPQGDSVPVTMERYAMQGTPTVLLIDGEGRLRMQHFGHLPDLELGLPLGALLG